MQAARPHVFQLGALFRGLALHPLGRVKENLPQVFAARKNKIMLKKEAIRLRQVTMYHHLI